MNTSITDIHIGSTTEVYLVAMKHGRTKAPIEGATIAWELQDSAGDTVATGSGSQVTEDVDAEDAPLYVISIGPEDSEDLEELENYTVVITVNGGQDKRKVRLKAKYREIL